MAAEPQPVWWRRPRNGPWIVFLVAAGVRVVYVLAGFEVPSQDTADYDEIALNLLSGEGFVARQNWFGYELRSWRPPLYPAFLACLYGVFGYGHLAVRLTQALLGAATATLVYGLGRRVYPGCALSAGLLAAIYGPLVASSNEVMSEALFTFFLVLAAYLLSDPEESRAKGVAHLQSAGSAGVSGQAPQAVPRQGAARPRDWLRPLAGGAATGLAALTRPVGLMLWPVQVALWIVRRNRGGTGTAPSWTRPTLWLSLGAAAVITPWTVRNWQVHGTLVPISTQGGFIIARSNAAAPDWRSADGWRIDRQTFERTPSETERDRRWLRQGLRFAASHPAQYLRLVGERILRFWYFLRPGYNFWFASLFPFFALGLWRFWNRGGFAPIGWLTLSSLAVFSLALYGSTRFRLPLEPFFILFATAFVHGFWRTRGPRRSAAVIGAVVAINGLLWWQAEGVRQLVLQCLSAAGLK